ncbi:hypothetical protein N2W52_001909 [Clostridium perfringens]|nr:hypothetical protein [Clostridium perfringens]MDK0982921.1 hypothetical protein [Clostridium perfringens]
MKIKNDLMIYCKNAQEIIGLRKYLQHFVNLGRFNFTINTKSYLKIESDNLIIEATVFRENMRAKKNSIILITKEAYSYYKNTMSCISNYSLLDLIVVSCLSTFNPNINYSVIGDYKLINSFFKIDLSLIKDYKNLNLKDKENLIYYIIKKEN